MVMAARKAAILLLVFLQLLGAALADVPSGARLPDRKAAPGTPQGASGRPPATGSSSMVVLFVNHHGVWERAAQDRWEAAGTVTGPAGVRVVPFSQALAPQFVSKMTPAQRDAALKYPEMLLNATRRDQVFAVRYVILDRYQKPDDGRTSPVLYDLKESSRVVLPEVRDHDLKRSLDGLSKDLRDGITRMTSPVWGHVVSHQYHVVDCDHVRQEQTIVIASEQEAVRNGYEPCAICFVADGDFRNRNGTEVTLGREVSAYIERRYRTDTDPERQARVDRVGQHLVDVNGLSTFHFTFRVLDVDAPNAFAAGAGAIYITRGLEKITAGNDDMLAAVLGHEIGHTEEHHVLRQYRQQQTWSVIGAVISVATGTNWAGLLSDFVGGILGLGYSRGFELEADRLGVIYAYDAGYRADDFILVINALKKVSGGKNTANWLRTHPTEDKRLERTRALVAQLQAFDRMAASYATVDAGMGNWIHRRAVLLVDHTQELSGEFPVMATAFGAVTSAASAPPSPTGTVDGGMPTAPVSAPGDTRVESSGPNTPPHFVHD